MSVTLPEVRGSTGASVLNQPVSPANAGTGVPSAVRVACSTGVASALMLGSLCCSHAGAPSEMAPAIAITTIPAVMRTSRWWERKASTRLPTSLPPKAKASSGIATPRAKERQRRRMWASTVPVAPATEIAASAGPAQGTKTAPMARPTTKPPLSRAVACKPPAFGSFWKGHSRASCTRGNTIPRPTRTSSAIPTFHRTSAGRPKALSSVVAKRVTRLKLVTSPPTTCHGRHREPPLTARTSGKTGKMQGEMPVIRPPVNPMNSVDNILCSFACDAVCVCN